MECVGQHLQSIESAPGMTYLQYPNEHTIVSNYLCFLSFSVDSKLAAQLSCLRCAKQECKEFSQSVETVGIIFQASMHHLEEQVSIHPHLDTKPVTFLFFDDFLGTDLFVCSEFGL